MLVLWAGLKRRNQWLFKLFDKASTQIQCGRGGHETLNIPLHGILELQAGYKGRINGVTLMSSNYIDTTSQT